MGIAPSSIAGTGGASPRPDATTATGWVAGAGSFAAAQASDEKQANAANQANESGARANQASRLATARCMRTGPYTPSRRLTLQPSRIESRLRSGAVAQLGERRVRN